MGVKFGANHPVLGIAAGVVALNYCKTSTKPQSEEKIWNGKPVNLAADPFKPVVMIKYSDVPEDSKKGICTATFVTDTLAVTAAHCLPSPKTGGVNLYRHSATAKPVKGPASIRAFSPRRHWRARYTPTSKNC